MLMNLVIITLIFFAVVALCIYVATELIPKWIFLKRHKVHKSSFEQFDIMDKKDDGNDL